MLILTGCKLDLCSESFGFWIVDYPNVLCIPNKWMLELTLIVQSVVVLTHINLDSSTSCHNLRQSSQWNSKGFLRPHDNFIVYQFN